MYVIIGGSGYLGRYCIKNILDETDDTIIATYSSNIPSFINKRLQWIKLDVCDEKAVKAFSDKVDPTYKIIYLAAYHHPDLVAKNPELAYKINITALSNILKQFHNAKCFYYSSTDSVYGEGSLYYKFKELDELHPVNQYGEQKVLAEKICLNNGRNVVRFPFIFGPSLVENKKHFYDKLLLELKSDKSIEMFSDSYRSTLSFQQCAYFLVKIIETFGASKNKIINISGDDALSKYDVGIILAKKYAIPTSFVKAISIDSSSSVFCVKRAKTTLLDNSLLKNLLKIREIKFKF